MYPDIPYDGLSWPITQHAGVIKEDAFTGLIKACNLCRGETVDAEKINDYLVSNNIFTANVRADSNQVDAWRDYQQILSEFGFLYSTRISKVVRLTPVAMAFMNGNLTYAELITLQVLRYQYPNGHKSQLSPSLVKSCGKNFSFDSFTALQAAHNILIRPAVLIWRILFELWKRGSQPTLTLDEMQTYVVRCTSMTDCKLCVEAIIRSRQGETALEPLSRARRNMADWIKILKQTMLFKVSDDGSILALSTYSIKEQKVVSEVCSKLSLPDTFWEYTESNYKEAWFDFYGNYDDNIEFVLKEKI